MKLLSCCLRPSISFLIIQITIFTIFFFIQKHIVLTWTTCIWWCISVGGTPSLGKNPTMLCCFNYIVLSTGFHFTNKRLKKEHWGWGKIKGWALDKLNSCWFKANILLSMITSILNRLVFSLHLVIYIHFNELKPKRNKQNIYWDSALYIDMFNPKLNRKYIAASKLIKFWTEEWSLINTQQHYILYKIHFYY